MTTTVSKVLKNADDAAHDLLKHWCDETAGNGGTFSIEHKYIDAWYTIYTINWPTTEQKDT